MKSISFKLAIIMLAVILIGISVTVGVAMSISGNVVISESLSKVHYNTKSEAVSMDSWLYDQKANITTLADALSAANDTSEIQQAATLNSVLKANPEYFDVYMGYPDGTATSGNGDEFDYSVWYAPDRDWYKLAMTNTSVTHITAPYEDPIINEICITSSRAVYSADGTLRGVVAADFLLTALSEKTLAATLDSKGYAMLIASNGDILVHPNGDFAPDRDGNFQKIYEILNGRYKKLWDQISGGETGSVKNKGVSGKMEYYTASPLESVDWMLITALPVSIVNRPITTAILIVFPLTLVIMAFAAYIIFRTIKSILTIPLQDIHSTIGNFSGGSKEIADGAQNVAQGSSEQSASMGQISSTLKSLVNDIMVNAEMAKQSAALSDSVKETAETGKGQMREMIESMKGINEAVRDIEKVMKVIEDISFQTNLLAVNATIEAARAGYEGRGFAVVADRVRELANRSSDAAAQTESLIENSIHKALAGAKVAAETSRSLDNITEGINKNTELSNRIAHSYEAQTASTNEISRAISQVANVAKNNNASAEKSANASRDMSRQADILEEMVTSLI